MHRLTRIFLDLRLTVRAFRQLVVEVRRMVLAVATLLITLTAILACLHHIV